MKHTIENGLQQRRAPAVVTKRRWQLWRVRLASAWVAALVCFVDDIFSFL